jgi:hypothetical protein
VLEILDPQAWFIIYIHVPYMYIIMIVIINNTVVSDQCTHKRESPKGTCAITK